MIISQATTKYLDDLVPLFDGYRVFYRQEANHDAVRDFLKERLKKDDSLVYIAFIDTIAVGFIQLYHLFSSVSMKPVVLLNDLFIHADY